MTEELMNPLGERHCPVCNQKLALSKHGSIEIDICEDHGVWLDTGELEAIVGRVKRSQRNRSRAAYRKGKSKGKVSGVLFGPLAFLFD